MNILELNELADIVIGMESMLLLELAMLRKDVISFRPNSSRPFLGEMLDATVRAWNQTHLKEILEKPIQAKGNCSTHFADSGKNIARILTRIAKR